MKKIFTLLAVCIFAMAAQAQDIHIRVQCDTAPFIWSWGSPNPDYNSNGDIDPWPGTKQLTDTWTDPDTGDKFWEFTVPEGAYPISLLFNNGASEGTKKTADINSVKSDRYFILSWGDETSGVSLVDITTDYTELPDAEVNTVSLAGNHNGWSGDSQWFDVVETGKKFQLTVDASAEGFAEENLWKFKFRPNGQEWVGYWDVYYDDENNPDPEDGRAPKSTAPSWLGATDDGNFLIDLEEDTRATKTYTITITWGGGKEAGKNWAFEITGPATGIETIKAIQEKSNAPIYNLQGQRISGNYRGIAIQNGKKVVVK